MRGRYYVMNGFIASCKADEQNIDRLMPKSFQGNAVEKLIRQGYTLNEESGILFSPNGKRIASFTQVM